MTSRSSQRTRVALAGKLSSSKAAAIRVFFIVSLLLKKKRNRMATEREMTDRPAQALTLSRRAASRPSYKHCLYGWRAIGDYVIRPQRMEIRNTFRICCAAASRFERFAQEPRALGASAGRFHLFLVERDNYFAGFLLFIPGIPGVGYTE